MKELSGKQLAKKIEELTIKQAIRDLNHLLAVPRCESLGFEADVLSITKTAFTHEFEIKISRGDFIKDSKKKKFQPEYVHLRSNHFWYVCPDQLIKLEEIPKEYGLCYYKRVWKGNKAIDYLHIMRRPERISSKKANRKIFTKMAVSLNWKLINSY